MADILEETERAHRENNPEGASGADFALHSAIVDAAHNATLTHIIASIYELTRQGIFHNREFLKAIDGTAQRLFEQHMKFGQAVIEGDGTRAEKAALDHIDFVEQSFRVGIKQQRREAMAEKRHMLSQWPMRFRPNRARAPKA